MKKKILIVDDSPFARDFLKQMVSGGDRLEVIGTASDGKSACGKIGILKPDLVLMDVHMPVMNGIEATAWIMEHNPTPVVIITNDDAKETAMNAMNVGALDVILKPTINEADNHAAAEKFIRHLARLAELKPKKISREKTVPIPETPLPSQPLSADAADFTSGRKETADYDIIAVASSTGGPKVLYEILPGLVATGLPVIITQHINEDFANQFSTWLGGAVSGKVHFAQDGEKIAPGQVLLAPPDIHIGVNRFNKIIHIDKPKLNFQKPSADYMFYSVAETFAARGIGIILTGMGRDGADGILKIKEAGGYTIAQDEESSVVFGMPREAIKLGGAREIMNYRDIPARLTGILS